MKNRISKLLLITSTFALGVSLFVVNSKKPIEVNASPVTENFGEYTYDGHYYDEISENASEGLSGSLRTSLTSLIFPANWYTYSSQGETHLATQLQYADEDPTNSSNMIYFYTRDSVKKNAASSWNREHVWPQSLSNGCWGEGKAGTDILHIRPTYNSTNSTRGNDKFCDVNKASPKIYNGMTFGYGSGGKFEPLDCVKGDVARIIMYTWVAYKNYYSNLPDVTNVFESYDTLLKWHTLDRPDLLEGNRNDYSETSKQKNRNPFVDHPEYAWKIFGNSASASVKAACQIAYPSQNDEQPEKIMTGISITGEATKKDYFEGDVFNPDGLTINAEFSIGSSEQINNSLCTWSPSPLTKGTTSVTCSYLGFTATYSGISVKEREQIDDEEDVEGIYRVKFKTSTFDSPAVITSSNTVAQNCITNTLVDTFSNLYKVYAGKNGLKLGSNEIDGDITLNLRQEANHNIVRIEIETVGYDENSQYNATLSNGENIAINQKAGNTFNKTFKGISLQSLTIHSHGIIYIRCIRVEISDNIQTSSSSEIASSQDQQSSTPSNDKKGKVGCGGSIIGIVSATSAAALVGFVLIFGKKKEK